MKRYRITLLVLLVAGHASAQQGLTLEECLRRGLESNYGVKIARNDAQIAANNVTYAPFLPTLTARAQQRQDGYAAREVYDQVSLNKESDYTVDTYGADVTLGWRLFDGMGMFATRETARELMRAGELSLRGSMEQLTADIASQYYFIVTQQRRLDAARRYLEISTLRYRQAVEKNTVGRISGLEMKQAKIDFNADSSKVVLQREVLDNAYIKLFELMNVGMGTAASLGDTIVPDGTLQLAGLTASAMDHNTAVLLARSGERVSELDLRIARSSLYPTLDLSAGYRYNRSVNGNYAYNFSDYRGPTWGLTLSVPVFNRLDTRRKIRNASLERENSTLLYERTCTEITSAMAQLFNTYRKNFRMIAFEEESSQAAMANLEAAMVMYRLGTMSGVEFREIQRSYLEAEERKLDAIYNAKISEINLIYLSGRIL